jgi:serine protease
VVAILDTGINQELPDFTGVNFVPGRNIVDGNNDTSDDIGHGTHVAGTIAQATNNAFGTVGMAFGVSIMPVKVIKNDLSSNSELITQGIDWAASNGADIINLSIGDPEAVTPEGMEGLHTAIQNAVSMGVTIVAAAGNNNDSVRYPAAFEEVVAVGAVDFAGNRTDYSNYGPELDIAAPGGGSPANVVGDGLRDAILQHTVIYVPLPAVQYGNEDFWFLAGTSQAAPHVTALAALLKSARPSLSPPEIRAAMENTAVDLGEPLTDPYYGKGLIDPVAALSFGINLYENITGFAARRIEEGSFYHCWEIHADAEIVELSLETPENVADIGFFLYNDIGRLVAEGGSLYGGKNIVYDVKLQGGVYYVVVRRDL